MAAAARAAEAARAADAARAAVGGGPRMEKKGDADHCFGGGAGVRNEWHCRLI